MPPLDQQLYTQTRGSGYVRGLGPDTALCVWGQSAVSDIQMSVSQTQTEYGA